MDCNRDDAIRSKEIAERKFRENDIAGAKNFALKAKALFAPLEGIDQMILALDVHLRAQTKIGGENDWYGILEVSAFADEETIRKQYKKLAFQTHPDKNNSVSAAGAFKIILDAWNVLSDKNKRILHDQKRYRGSLGVHQSNSHGNANSTSNSCMSNMNGFCSRNSGPAPVTSVLPYNCSVPSTFWTYCSACGMSFQYSREYLNRYLKCPVCQAVFVAVEVSPPSDPIYPTAPRPMDTNIDIGDTAVPDSAMPGTGVASGSQNYDPMLQQWSSFRFATGAHTSRYPVQQTHETARKEEVAEANVARNEEADLGRKVTETVRKHARSDSSLGSSISAKKITPGKSSTKEKEAAKRKCINDDKNVVFESTSSGFDGDLGPQMHPAKRKPSSLIGTSGTKRRKASSGNAETSLGKVLHKLKALVRGMLIDKTRLQLRDKLEDFNRNKANMENKEQMQTSKESSKKIACSTAVDVKDIERKQSSNSVHPEEDNGKELASKKVVSEEKERAQGSKHVGLDEKEKSWNWTSPEIRIVYTRRNRKEQKRQPGADAVGASSSKQHHLDGGDSCLDQEPPSDEGSGEMPVPDADFYSFGDHSESSFQNDQVWAVYDEEDGMPRYYALIRKVLSSHPFKARLAFLKADDCNEFGTSNWISCGYSKTCGDFKVGASKDTDQLNTFSHVVTWEKGAGGIIRIFPKKGDIWALYQNWSPDWNEFTPDDTLYKYELVEVLDRYNPSEGISVMPIDKVPGFVSVFKPHLDPTKSRRIPKAEMLRFSHQVPFHVLTGEEAQNSPKGCYELDPGSTPKELLQVVPQSDDAK